MRFLSFVPSMAAAILMVGAVHATAADYTNGDITVSKVWSRATPPTARVGGGYMTIENKGAEADRLVAVHSDISQSVEVHEMSMSDDNVMRMRKLENGLPIEAGETVELKPGSYHLMFIGLEKGLVEGETFDATVEFEKAGTIDVTFDIEAMGVRQQSEHNTHDADAHDANEPDHSHHEMH